MVNHGDKTASIYGVGKEMNLNENEERETFQYSDTHPPILDIMSGLNWMCGLNTDICTNIAPAIGWHSRNYCDYVENSDAAAVGTSLSPAQSAVTTEH